MQEINGDQNGSPILVGVGASAGGLDALMRFFEQMPADSGLAFAVVLHTTPDHDGHLAEVIQKVTPMPVAPAIDALPVEPNHVYCIPPDKRVSFLSGLFRVVDPEETNGRRVPIDLFFRALAHAYREKAIAVVLSGGGADGSLGLARIREEGGVSIAQDPNEAEHAHMPRNAIETGCVDFILPVGLMPEKLVSLKQNADRIQLPPARQPPRNFEEGSLRELLALLRARTRHDFTSYKRSTLLRRIERRLQVTESEDVPAYLEHIRRNPEELQGLLRDLLISVTNFFRDPEAFARLQTEIVPRLFENKGGGDQIRVWVPGCATGEEAYSLAILLAEHAETLTAPPGLQVFATDIDEDALAHGRTGVYPETIAADVSPERLKRFFVREGHYYRVRRELRETVLFAPHNLLRDPPFSKLDLVSCRNLLIYINRTMQERILEIFHFALKPGGHLFLGSSESAEGLGDLFTPADKKNRIFKRHEDGSAAFRPAQPPPANGEWMVSPAALLQLPPTDPHPEPFSYGELHYRLLEALAPPSVLVNADYDIVHLSEHAGRYLRLSGGEPTRNLLKVAHPDLRLELRSLLLTAVQEGYAVSSHVLVNLDGAQRFVRVGVRPPTASRAASGFMLVVFDESEAAARLAAAAGDGDDGDGATAFVSHAGTLEPIVRQLEAELERTRDQLRATVEEYETSTEELKASNEELQAMNEELRSASEELETGKEELQSVNEELTTLNHELREKVDELGRANSDLQNLMASTRIATLFLNRHLRLMRYTPSAQEMFNVIPGDMGRPLAHVTHKLYYPTLVEDAERVLRDLHTIEREVSTLAGRHFLARLLPYRTIDDKIAGVVLTFTDIHERKTAEEAVAADLRDTQILRELATHSATDGEVQVLYDKVLETAVALTRADAGTIQLLDGKTQELALLAARGLGPEMTARFARVDARSHTPCRVALATGSRTFFDYDDGEAEDLDGSLRAHAEAGFLSAQSTPLVTRTGRPIGMFTTHWRERRRPTERELRFLDLLARQAADLIEQWRAARVMRESEAVLQKAVSIETAGVLFFRLDGRIQDANETFVRMSGYTREELLGGMKFAELTAPEFMEATERAVAELAGCGETAPYEKEMIRKDGSRWWGLFAPTRLSGEGAESECVEFIIDITESKRAEEELRASEERLRLVVETAQDYAIMIMDSEGRYTDWNTGAERMFGYTAAEAVGQKTDLIFTPEDRAAGVPEKELRAADHNGRASDERWHTRKDGSHFYVSGVLVALRHGHGYAKIARDLTSQRRVQDELRQAWEELERRVAERTAELAEANSALREEVGVRRRVELERLELLRRIVTTQEDERRRISRELHDQLGQSLTALRLKLEGLEAEAGRRSKLQGRIAELSAIVQRLDTDVDFLAWELRPSALDDLGLIVALSNYAQEWAKHFGVKINFHSAGLGDARLAPLIEINLYRIAQEALNNISKHAAATSVDLLLERRSEHVALIVEDNGRGFEPNAAGLPEDGRGMGLIGMRERAALVGGEVEVESAPGEGTTVFVRVPATPPDQPA